MNHNSNRSGRVKKNSSGATWAEEEDQEDNNIITLTKQAYGDLPQHHFPPQASLPCSLCSPQASQKRYSLFYFLQLLCSPCTDSFSILAFFSFHFITMHGAPLLKTTS